MDLSFLLQRISLGKHGSHVCEDEAVGRSHCVFRQHGQR